MDFKELIEKLNKYCSENEIYDLEDIGGQMQQELDNVDFHYVTTVDRDEHRWYVLAENVYAVFIEGKNYYMGVWEVETLKSERMSISDCMCDIEFYEMEEYTTVSYRRKENKE